MEYQAILSLEIILYFQKMGILQKKKQNFDILLFKYKIKNV